MHGRAALIFRLLVLLTLTGGMAQTGGTAVYRFLSLSPSPIQTALGGKQFTDIPYDILQNFSNPALVDASQSGRIGLNYTAYITDINYGQLGYVWKIPGAGAVFTGVTYLNYGKFTAANESGDITGTFTASETAFQIGYGRRLKAHWYAGVTLKWIYSQLERFRSHGVAADLALRYAGEFTDAVLLVRNAGFQLTTYNGTREPLPFEIALSYARLLEHAPLRLYVTWENLQKPLIAFPNPARAQIDPDGNVREENIRFYHHIFRHLITGVEFFPRKRFRLRTGFNFRRAAELGLKDVNFSSGLAFGFGLRLNKFSVDYGYGQYHFAGNAHHLGIHIFLNPADHEKD
ncbi:MAG: type IX secretion system protein PorQ [Chlorobi bacterium]|nr:type IX secretion system protein PorQ [Chlorobiota bacterium]